MSTFEEETTKSLQSLFVTVDALTQINIRDLLKPDVYYHYERTLQEAYDALTKVEDALDSLGMKLEYHHWRLGGVVEELKPLLILTFSPSDRITEEFERRMSHIDDQLSPETTGWSATLYYRYFVDEGNTAWFRASILSNLSTDEYYLMGLKRDTIPSPQTTGRSHGTREKRLRVLTEVRHRRAKRYTQFMHKLQKQRLQANKQ